MHYKIWVYGSVLALLAILLDTVNHYHFVRIFPTEGYVFVLALFFTALGIWAGRKLSSPSIESKEFTPNTKAMEYLGISERETEVLKLLAEGHSNQQIADKLFISVNTVKTHVSSLLSKLDARRRTQAVKKARSLRLIP